MGWREGERGAREGRREGGIERGREGEEAESGKERQRISVQLYM